MVPRRRSRKKAQCQANARLTRCQANARCRKHRDPAGLAWPLHPYIPYYNRAAVLGCTASGRDAGIWYVLEVLRRCDTLQRGAGGIIAAFAGLVSWRWNWANLRKSPCKALCAILCCWLYKLH
jgi:hypothetical protein